MNTLSKKLRVSLSAVLAVVMLLSVFTAGAPAAFAAGDTVKSIAVENIVMYENMENDEIFYDEDEGKYYYYPKYTVTLSDGTVLKSDEDGEVKINGVWCCPGFSDDQSTNDWGVGTHQVTAALFGATAQFTVEIKAENPIESVSCDEEIQLIEKEDGYYETDYDDDTDEALGEYFNYNIRFFKLNVKFKDGTTQVAKAEPYHIILNGKEYYSISMDWLEQGYNNELKVGDTQTLSGTAFGKEFTAKVKIVPTPVKSVSISPLTVIKGYDDYNDRYNIDNNNFTVNLNDGTSLTSDEDGYVLYNNNDYYIHCEEPSEDDVWTPGNTYKVNASIIGFDTSFDVKVVDNPVASVQFDDIYVDETDYIDESYYDEDTGKQVEDKYYWVDANNFTVKLKDGNTVKGEKGKAVIYDRNLYPRSFTHKQSDGEWKVGEVYTTTASFCGVEAPIKVHVVAKGQKPADQPKEETKPADKKTANTAANASKTIAKKIPKPVVKQSPMTAKAKKKTITVKAKKLKKKKVTVKAITVKNAKGKVTYTKLSGKKNFKVNKKTGKITIKKGTKKKTYKVKIKVTDSGNNSFTPVSKTVTVKIKVK